MRTFTRHILVTAVLSAVTITAVTGCGGSSTTASTGSPSASGNSSASGSATADAGDGIPLYSGMSMIAASSDVDTSKYKSDVSNPKIGYASLNLVNSFQVQRSKSAELVAQEYGAELITTNANNDASTQVSNIEDLLAQGVDALVISPVNSDSLTPVLKRAAQANIPVIVEGTDVESTDVLSRVFSTNDAFGATAAKGLCDLMSGQGKVVMLRGIAGVQAETERYDAAKAEMEKCGLEVEGEAFGNWNYAGGQTAAETLVAQYPQIDGVWSSGSEMTRAAIDVFEAKGRPLVPMTGECENGFLQIWQDKGLKAVAPIFPTWQTPEAVKLALKALRGEQIKASYSLELPAITDANVSQFANTELSKDWWSDGVVASDGTLENYLTPDQVKTIFS